ncbi:hypothetical protein K439DRAFT_1649019 [Ramaria rubella]|nr:hypothetical protein K439DRAFT_1649019 [Ramaria rubella]
MSRVTGILAVAVNGETYNGNLAKDLHQQQHHAILTSAEMALEHAGFSELIKSPDFSKDIAAVVIDESHCVSQWGEKFRPLYARLDELHSHLGLNVPFLMTSATLPPLVFAEVLDNLEFIKGCTFILNLGNDHANIKYTVHGMKAGKLDLASLDFLVEGACQEGAWFRGWYS